MAWSGFFYPSEILHFVDFYMSFAEKLVEAIDSTYFESECTKDYY